MSNSTRLARGLLALAAFGALFTAPAAAAAPAAPAPACAEDLAAGPCTDNCRRKYEDGRRNCDLAYDRCLRGGTSAVKCREQNRACRARAEQAYRRCLGTCTRRADGQVADM
ncbi:MULTISPECIES: hypothetical protein [unclassified Crossiella]|uniref:hypothetical protein n=1 Tax=unclassified Crossiella TaxID=2620835 RepID=UPI001FFFAC17|nr:MULTISPECIES: hypothetical protein [unclassified Crossiella]MCK2238923.1 hypothetical protein [Crossiella sp. S99.2]MCK2251507.1 hypothetical protein [Crossiella sp. S99.1]